MRLDTKRRAVCLPRHARIARITTEIHMTLPGDHPQRALLEKAALGCPVHLSLHPDVEKPVTITWLS